MLKVLAITAFFVTFLLGWPQVTHEQQTPATNKQRETDAHAKPIPPLSTTVNPVMPTPEANPKSNSAQNNTPEKPMPRFTRPEWVIVYITAVYVVISALMLVAIRRQADLTEVTAKRQLRSYLCVEEACVKITEGRIIEDRPWTMLEGQLYIKNGGQTPAYDVRAWVHGSLRPYPESIPVSPPPEGMPRGIAIIPAQGKHIIVAKETAQFPNVMENLKAPNLAYYVQGEVIYRDIFKDWRRLKIRMFLGGPPAGSTGVRTTADTNGKILGFLVPDSWGNSEEDIPQPEDQQNPN